MAQNKITVIHGDAAQHGCSADLMLTDPPFEMDGAKLAKIVAGYDVQHLVLITTMRQLLQFSAATIGEWHMGFDFVIDGVMPKKSKSLQQPNYVHQTGVYYTRGGARSIFNRKRRQRSDVFEANGYWPTLFHAPRDNVRESGYAKNIAAITDLLGSFEAASVVDPFMGVGTTVLAAIELEMRGTGIELNRATFDTLRQALKFIGRARVEIVE